MALSTTAITYSPEAQPRGTTQDSTATPFGLFLNSTAALSDFGDSLTRQGRGLSVVANNTLLVNPILWSLTVTDITGLSDRMGHVVNAARLLDDPNETDKLLTDTINDAYAATPEIASRIDYFLRNRQRDLRVVEQSLGVLSLPDSPANSPTIGDAQRAIYNSEQRIAGFIPDASEFSLLRGFVLPEVESALTATMNHARHLVDHAAPSLGIADKN